MDAIKIKFIDEVKPLFSKVELTEDYTVYRPKIKLKVEPMSHQLTILDAMLDLEDRRYVKFINVDFNEISNRVGIIETNACVLSEDFGSGKSYIILLIIMMRPIPKLLSENISSIFLACGKSISNNYRVFNGFKYELNKKIITQDFLPRTNLIIVSKSVLNQWVEYIKKYTDLINRTFVIGDVRDFNIFYDLLKKGIIKRKYDIVLLKNSKFTNFKLDGEVDPPKTRTTTESMFLITQDIYWARVIYDDFDVINVKSNDIVINAFWHIYVSATNKYNNCSDYYRYDRVENLNQLIKRSEVNHLFKSIDDAPLFKNLNIRCSSSYLKQSCQVPTYKTYKYVYNNIQSKYLNLIKIIGKGSNMDTVIQMLNSCSNVIAAEKLGLVANSPATIFEKLLDNTYKKHILYIKTIDYIDNTIEYIESLMGSNEFHNYLSSDVDEIKKKITLLENPNKLIIGYSDKLIEELDNMCETFLKKKEKSNIIINRVKDNIKEGICPVCNLTLKGGDVFINKCCGTVLDSICWKKTTHLYKCGGKILGKCPNCMNSINLLTDMIVIKEKFNIDTILSSRGDEYIEGVDIKIDNTNLLEATLYNKNKKLINLLKIIRCDNPKNKKLIKSKIMNVLEGSVYIEPPKDLKRKFLIFTNYNESINLIDKFLTENLIKFSVLRGQYKTMTKIIHAFKTSDINVLIINSEQNCAGLDLQFASDLIYFHRIIDQSVESQVGGRIQRIGRQYSANIHYLCFKNEDIFK